MSVSLSGDDEDFGMTMQAVVRAAVDTINAAGGADGHDLEVLYVDDLTTPEGAGAAADELIAAGAVGIIGPFNSGPVEATLDAIEAAEVPLLSPSSTAPRLALDTPELDWLFRTAPNDNFQVLAMSYYFESLVTPAVDAIAIVHESGTYGEGLATALESEWVDVRDHSLSGAAISFEPGLDVDQTALDVTWGAIESQAPAAVVVIGVGTDINPLMREWIASGNLPDLQWFFSDSVKATSVFGADTTLLTAEADGQRGTAPTSPITSVAYQTFVSAVEEVEGIDVSDQAYTQNTWDAVYLLAAALVQQSVDGDEFGGVSLRDALHSVSRDGQTLPAGQWRDLVSRIRSGGDVDYDGASGPVDFTSEGETKSPYEVWQMDLDGNEWSFSQVEYIETDQLE